MQNLTLVIPTFNRPGHLSRLLSYYAGKNPEFSILVLDSSEPEIQSANSELLRRFAGKAQHMGFPGTIRPSQKLAEGLQHVGTPYAALCADDDIVFPEALGHALDFLGSHPDYVCCDGIYLNFGASKGEINLSVEYGSRSIEAEHPGARVFRLFQRYESLFYAVYRTPDMRDLFSFIKDIPSYHFQELFQAAGTVLKGKTHRLAEFYAARQDCVTAEPTREKWQTFYWFADNNLEFLQHYQGYRDELWRFYDKFSAEPRMQRPTFNSVMDTAHVTFFSTNYPPHYFHSRLQQHWPTEAFKDMRGQDRVYNDLFLERQLTWEPRLIELVARVIDAVRLLLPRLGKRSLAKEAARMAEDSLGWRCNLDPGLWWMASVPRFRNAFLELCRYLGETAKQQQSARSENIPKK